jgi:hypothetical protein
MQVECLKPKGQVLSKDIHVPWEHIVQVIVAPSNTGDSAASTQPCVVQFGYSEEMNTVLAECSTHKGLLDSIAEDDDGLLWPHCAHSFVQAPPLPLRGRPYKWCQHLGGLDLYQLPSSVAELADGSGMYTFSTAMFIRRMKRLLAAKV